MEQNWYFVFACALGASFLVSICLTSIVRHLALRFGMLDHPGERKVHSDPVPLMGGVAIFGAFYLVVFGIFLCLRPVQEIGFVWLEANVLQALGPNVRIKLMGIFAGSALIFLLGVVDDIKVLKPEIKLVGQIAAALVLVFSGIRLELFIENILEMAHVGQFVSDQWMGYINLGVSGLVTILWVIMMTNSMNFLDNMDGLSAGVAVIAALSFFLCVVPGSNDIFVCILLMAFAGAVGGFLYHNLNPARIFMGDAGSMFCGYLLATVAVLGTFYTEEHASRAAIAAPLLALSVPIFDTISVIIIRMRRGESIMKGDKRHFSHRLVELGMTSHQAVEFIFLVAAVTGLGAALLPQVGKMGTLILLAQTGGVFLLIVLLMNAGKENGNGRS